MKGFLERLNQPMKLPKLNQPIQLPQLNQPLSLPQFPGLAQLAFWRRGAEGSGEEGAPKGAAGGEGRGGESGAVGLTAGWTPPLDLLRERRQELELEPLSGLLVQRPVLLRRGLMWGGFVLGASLGVCGVLLLWQQMLKARMKELEKYEVEVQQLTQALTADRAALKAVKEGNDKLVERLINVRSSSALLADLQQRVPEGVQLNKVRMEGVDGIRVEGVARDPVAFGRVNALELVLRQSPLLAATEVKVSKAVREPPKAVQLKEVPGSKAVAGGKDGSPPKLELPSAVTFELAAKLTPLEADRLVKVMEGLKAEGMVRRVGVLERGGLLP